MLSGSSAPFTAFPLELVPELKPVLGQKWHSFRNFSRFHRQPSTSGKGQNPLRRQHVTAITY